MTDVGTPKALTSTCFEHIAPASLTFDRGRAMQKAKYCGELFLPDAKADEVGALFREFFQRGQDGNAQGIVVIDLKDLT